MPLDPEEQPFGQFPTTPISIKGLPDFWLRLRDSERIALFLDYDGTLAPFNADRFMAVPLPGVREAVEGIANHESVYVTLISGRPVAEVQELLGSSEIPIVGTHGFELYKPGAEIVQWNLASHQVALLDHAENIAIDLIGKELTERKLATVAVHVRGKNPSKARQIMQQFHTSLEPLVNDQDMEIRAFDGGIELRASGRDKGKAMLDILYEYAPVDLIVYIGDDDTDEDAFKALPAHGIGIKVGSVHKPTAAKGHLPSCEAVRQLLWDWIQINQ